MASDITQDFSALSLSDGEDEDEEFKEISKFTSSFDLSLQGLTKPRIEALQRVLVEKLPNGFVLKDEEVQVYNLISYLSFLLHDMEGAFKYNAKALDRDRRNGIAWANRARFNWYQMKFFIAKKDLEELKGLYSNDNAAATTEMIAKGELAQSYARFGPKYHELAISTYETIFQAKPRVNRRIMILWKYDYCLTLRRARNLFARSEHPKRNDYDTLKTACAVLSDIIDTSDLKTYTARAWAELGQLVYDMEKHPETFGSRTIQELIPRRKQTGSSETYFEKALQLDSDDFDVIEVCAKFYRYFDKPEKAVSLFHAALQRRKTSLCYHHLALSLKKIEVAKLNNQRNQRRSWRHKGWHNKAQTLHQKEQSNFKKSIKCGRYAKVLPFTYETREILINLDQAVSQDPHNHFASYDKALTLRELQRTEEAKDEFVKLSKNVPIGELKISCYEQAGYCCLDLAEIDTETSERYMHDAIRFLQKAIEVAAAVAAKVKYTSINIRPLIPTVKSMLTNPKLIQTHDTHMQRLRNLLIQHGHLLPIAEAARSDDGKDTKKLLNFCLQNERRDDAALLCVLEEILAEPGEETFVEHLRVILMSASTSLSNGESEAALTLYQIFYKLLGMRTHTTDKDYDVFLMADGETETLRSMHSVSEWLNGYCGLKVVNSDDHISYGKQVLSELIRFSETTTAVFVVLKDKQIDPLIERVTTIILSIAPHEEPPKLVILKDKSLKLPLEWKNVPTVLLPDESIKPDNSYISAWITNAFRALMPSPEG